MADHVKCPVCGLGVPAGQNVCPNDGTPLLMSGVEIVRKDPLIGALLGDYQVEECIGVGAMGVVYRAVQPVIGKRVAVKVLRADVARSAAEMQRLLAEARTVNNIGHRGVIDIFGFGQTPDGRQYFLMEHLNGQPLDRLIAERAPLPPPEAIAILDELLDALGAIHQAGVIHRDLKPSNIFLVAQRGRPAFVKILDFGLSKQALVDAVAVIPSVRPAQQSTIAGTPEFMAPELFKGGMLSARSDLYAVGVTAFEVLTGKLPFPAASVTECIKMHLEQPAPEPSSVYPSVPPQLDAWCLQLMAKDPAARPATAELARRDLKRIRHQLAIGETQVAVRLTPSGYAKVAEVLAKPPQPTTETEVKPPASPSTEPSGLVTARPRRAAVVLLGLAVVIAGAAGAIAMREKPQAATLIVPPPPRPAPSAPAPLAEVPALEPLAAEPPAKAPKAARGLRRRVETGTLAVKAKQYSTSFKLDGRELGGQPAGRTFENIRAGTHHLQIMQNEKKFERSVTVEPGATAIVEVVFQ